MSKLKEKELLELLETLKSCTIEYYKDSLGVSWDEKEEQAYQQIKEMIQAYAQCQEIKADYMNMILQRDLLQAQLEKKPEVTEEFVGKYAQKMMENWCKGREFHKPSYGKILTQMLKEAGMEIVGNKDE